MYKLGDLVVYGSHGVCCIIDTELRPVDRKKVEYFVLEPREQPGARFYVPTQNQAALSKMRPLLDRKQLEELLAPDAICQNVWVPDENRRKQRYRELLSSGDRAALISMIRLLHLHREEQLAAGRKFHLCDENFLRDAERLLASEFSMVLGMDFSETTGYLRTALRK